MASGAILAGDWTGSSIWVGGLELNKENFDYPLVDWWFLVNRKGCYLLLLSTRYAIANSPAIANTDPKPGSSGVGVGVAAGGIIVGVVTGVGTGGVGEGKCITAILVMSLIKPLDFADITAIPDSLEVNFVEDESVPLAMVIEEGTDPRSVEILTVTSTSVSIGSSFSSSRFTVLTVVSSISLSEGSAVSVGCTPESRQ